jgi:glycerol-3-phosphate dehydrogenase
MKRSIENLANQIFDVLVIGGGIHGAVTAWDAALRGLSVALIERGDFGGATSQNSLKIIHGGLRYLQDGNLPRIRKMAYERTTWMKIAPHLVHPLPCLMPTRKKLARSNLAMSIALKMNDILSFDRNRLPDREKYLPAGRIIPTQDCSDLLPGYDTSTTTGAALWHDGQIYNSERLLLEFILSAANKGAEVANYVEAAGFIHSGQQITGVKARDCHTGETFEIRSRVVINSAGAWVDKLLDKVAVRSGAATSVAMNLVVDKVWSGAAAALSSQPGKGKRSQVLLFVPWQNKTLIGTWHLPWSESPDAFKPNEDIIQAFLDEINTAHPRLALSLADVHHVAWGFLPVSSSDAKNKRVRLMRDDLVVDHQKRDDISGLISVISVKYTTARATAEKVIDLAVKMITPESVDPCKTGSTPVSGGSIQDFKTFLDQAKTEKPYDLEEDVIQHLVYTYGSAYPDILLYVDEQPRLAERIDPQSPVIGAEVVHGARFEMAQTLVDIIQRRTEIGASGLPSLAVLRRCADLAGEEIGWSEEKKQQEIDCAVQAYPIRPIEKEMA